MNKFNLNVDYKLKFTTEEKKTPEEIELAKAELTVSYIEYAVTSVNSKGLTGQFRRLYAGLQDKFEKAIESKKYAIELNELEAQFLVKTFSDKELKFMPQVAKYVVTLEDEIDTLVKK